MSKYDPKKIESKWQKYWDSKKIYTAKDKGEKDYILVEFPYPSGDGLHVGHVRSYTALDVVARKRRMEGKNVLYPMGWDAFGLPAESYAVKTGIHPEITTKKNIGNFKKQMKSLGLSFDWSREINTTDPKYFKWTQWIFLQFLKAGLAYKAKSEINWCPKDKIGLANEEVVDGKCERCGTPVEKREKEQWMLAITQYADRLDKDLDLVDYPDRVKTQQRNWIGKKEGATIMFDDIEIFTTRPETIFGATYIAIAGKADKFTGRHVLNPATKEKIPVWEAEYVMEDVGTGALMGVPAHDERDFDFAKKHNLPIKFVVAPYFLDNTENSKPRENVETRNRKIAVGIVKHWSEDKYLMLDWKNGWTGFITGGVEEGEDLSETMIREIKEETGYKNTKFVKHLGVPNYSDFYAPHKKLNQHVSGHGLYLELIDGAQDEVSEEEFKKHDFVWKSKDEVFPFLRKGAPMGDSRYSEMFWNYLVSGETPVTDNGVLVESGIFNGKFSEKVKDEIIKFVGGKKKTTFKLRDWIFSRQRYWGEPIPVIHCEKCGVVPVPEKDLPVKLPKVKKYAYTDTGESPLANVPKWVNVKCPQCKGKAKRETDTMPNWAGSSWYFYRYGDPKNSKAFAGEKALKYWQPVDWYNGGMEHTTLHLLYSRFWNKFLFDQKLVPTTEPYAKRTSHGLILAEGGVKMSKSIGNVINPDDIVKVHGADTLRLYEMFMGPFEQSVAWSTDGIVGPRRFLERVAALIEKVDKNIKNQSINVLEQTISKVSSDIEGMGFNTAVSQLMICTNALEKEEKISQENFARFLQVLAPFAPHLTEELWNKNGGKKSIHISEWPKAREIKEDTLVKIAVQINGKTKGTIDISKVAKEDEVRKMIENDPSINKHLTSPIKKIIYVPGRIVNVLI